MFVQTNLELKILIEFGELCPRTKNTPAVFRPKGTNFNLRSVVTVYLFENTNAVLDLSHSLLQIMVAVEGSVLPETTRNL